MPLFAVRMDRVLASVVMVVMILGYMTVVMLIPVVTVIFHTVTTYRVPISTPTTSKATQHSAEQPVTLITKFSNTKYTTCYTTD